MAIRKANGGLEETVRCIKTFWLLAQLIVLAPIYLFVVSYWRKS